MDKVKDLAYINQHHVEMFFFPRAWEEAVDQPNLKWKSFDFPPKPRKRIPKLPGVYAFVVEPNMFNFGAANGLFYIGKATSLYERVGAYITDLNSDYDSKNTRAHVWMMLNQWNTHLKYYYVTTNTVQEAENLEDQMILSFKPHYNKKLAAKPAREQRAYS
jgi:excinuclease UvrABC nuclease subunit